MDGLLNSPEAGDTMCNYSIAPVTSFQPGHNTLADPTEPSKHNSHQEGLHRTIPPATKTMRKKTLTFKKSDLPFPPFPSPRYYFILHNMETLKCFYVGRGPTVLGAVHTHTREQMSF